MPRAQVRTVDDHGIRYDCLAFVCPGCAEFGGSGLHMLPVNCADRHQPSWDWDGDLEAPTLSPSILTGRDSPKVCHSYLRAGVFEFLGDCAHSLAGRHVPMPDLPDWIL